MESELRAIAEKVNNCRKCRLCEGALNGVPGEGSSRSGIMFIGEAPGRFEDIQGRPFVGAAGKLLSQMLESIGLKREDVFITSIVKHRPPKNREPKPDEVKACAPYLKAQIKALKPRLIVTLGRHAMDRFFPGLKISEVHGTARKGTIGGGTEQNFFLMYHPASALHNPLLKGTLFEDFKKIPEAL